MHRYIIRLHIVQASDEYSIHTSPLSTYIFDETAFIAVTAYQNDKVDIFTTFVLNL
jgi:T-box protein 2/T-box protein 3